MRSEVVNGYHQPGCGFAYKGLASAGLGTGSRWASA